MGSAFTRFYFYQNIETKEWITRVLKKGKDEPSEIQTSPKMYDAYLYTLSETPACITMARYKKYFVDVKRLRPPAPRRKRSSAKRKKPALKLLKSAV